MAEVNIFHYNTVPAEVISQKYDMYSTIAIKQYKKVTSDLLRGQGYFIVSAVVLITDVLSFSFFFFLSYSGWHTLPLHASAEA